MPKTQTPCCDTCTHCPNWETGFAMGKDFESQFYKSGECKANEEPILYTQGKYFVDGSRDGASVLMGCKNYTPKQDTRDKIVDRMEGDIPKNGR